MGSAVIYLPFFSTLHCLWSSYQLALVTPGTSPASANLRKQILHRENLRRNPRGRPQFLQRFRRRTLNFGCFASLAIFAVVAMKSFSYCRNGMPMWRRSARPSASVFAVVVMEMFIPFTLSTLL